ncbi:MAG: hypothetical protein V4773_02445, partial [Verrucomicrobiota bacterium]
VRTINDGEDAEGVDELNERERSQRGEQQRDHDVVGEDAEMAGGAEKELKECDLDEVREQRVVAQEAEGIADHAAQRETLTEAVEEEDGKSDAREIHRVGGVLEAHRDRVAQVSEDKKRQKTSKAIKVRAWDEADCGAEQARAEEIEVGDEAT